MIRAGIWGFGAISRSCGSSAVRTWAQRAIASVCAKLGLVHGVDQFAEESVTAGSGFAYFRLYGAPPGKRMYRYTYTDGDLKELAAREMHGTGTGLCALQ